MDETLHDNVPNLRDDAIAIWHAGLDAVRPDRLVPRFLQADGDWISVGHDRFRLANDSRIAVVGAGKAGAAMAAAVEEVLESLLPRVVGWVNVPADCVRQLRRIHLHAARPPGVNEPTAEGVAGARRILEIVAGLERQDLCLVLLSGGGSALLPAPLPPVKLEDKRAVTHYLMHAGADIRELNAVRKRLSSIKGGGLTRHSRAGKLITLIISDIVGDPLDMIASGPTVPECTTNDDALAVLRKYGAAPPAVPQRVFDVLSKPTHPTFSPVSDAAPHTDDPEEGTVSHFVIGNNATALEAADRHATQLGYQVISLGSANTGEAAEQGRYLAGQLQAIRDDASRSQSVCLLSGGEPVVAMQPHVRLGKGGRNQQLVLAALAALWADRFRNLALLSGGTDGEDGPTDAAGAVADQALRARAEQQGLVAESFLRGFDSYRFFEPLGGLLRTGPTQTNVMDLRVGLVRTR